MRMSELSAYMFELPDGSIVVDTAEKIRELREMREADLYHYMEPGRWGDHASPARMRRDVERDREEDRERQP